MKWNFPFGEEGGEGGSKMFESAGGFSIVAAGALFSIEWLTSHLLALISHTFSLFLPSSLHYPKREILTERGRGINGISLSHQHATDHVRRREREECLNSLFLVFFCGELPNFRAQKNQSITYLLQFISLRVKKMEKKSIFAIFSVRWINEKWKRDEIAWRFVNFFYLFQTDVCTSSFEKSVVFTSDRRTTARTEEKRKRKKKCTHAPCFPNPASEYEYSPRAKIPPAPKKLRPSSIKVLFFPRKKKREKKNSSSLGKGEEETNFPGQGHSYP